MIYYIFQKDDFSKFVRECQNSKETIVGVTKAKTEEAVFAKVEDNRIIKFSTSEKYEYEWCGIAYFYNLIL
ncbi:hypothetical protein NF27_HE00230 [Candidatus Jidaibacter acanthamoeba]|uniref:Uncharacterized protein n=1 Tax=Candidatus Jidaibacter acanthamoebae TaxID=86105 RepID=A0A0C1QGF2_9RICK|nr:hypothetical protein NF27_HE00230 [Candidatus Jidaibacter acanthamoeba]